MTKVVDCQWHWNPPAYYEAHLGRESYPRVERTPQGFQFEISPTVSWESTKEIFDLDYQLEVMESSGVDVMVASSAPLAIDILPLAEAKEICRLVNEEKAQAEQRHAGKFVGLANLPMADPDAAVEELRYARNELGLRGVCILSNVAGGSIARPEYARLYEELEKLDVPVFLHPTQSVVSDRIAELGLEYILSYMYDTSVAALSLVLSRLLDRFGGLRVVHPHVGAVLPYLSGRIDYEYKQPWAMGETLPREPTEYLRTMYTDTVCLNADALRMAEAFYGVEKMLFASDYPYWPIEEQIELVRSTFGEEDAEAILGKNALRLLGLDESR